MTEHQHAPIVDPRSRVQLSAEYDVVEVINEDGTTSAWLYRADLCDRCLADLEHGNASDGALAEALALLTMRDARGESRGE